MSVPGHYAVLLGDDQAAAAAELRRVIGLANADWLAGRPRLRLGQREDEAIDRWLASVPWAMRPFGRLDLRPVNLTIASLRWHTFGPYRLTAVAAARTEYRAVSPIRQFLPPLRGYYAHDTWGLAGYDHAVIREDVLRVLAYLAERELDPAGELFGKATAKGREIDESELGPIADWLEESDRPATAVRIWMALKGHF